jgi:SP family general alpha glucoside:H+ symporter-like MFS transporter
MLPLAISVLTGFIELSVGTTYWDCFKGFERRRTEIACVVFGGQLVCGLCFAYASTYCELPLLFGPPLYPTC